MRPPPLLPSSAIETSAPGTFDEARATSIYLFALRVLAILFEHHCIQQPCVLVEISLSLDGGRAVIGEVYSFHILERIKLRKISLLVFL